MKNKLLKRSNGGFSLVELIVVIAIMAILVGVAVPVYSSYIEKSQKAADRNTVGEITHAMEIAFAGEQFEGTAAVILTTNGYTVSGGSDAATAWITKVMQNTFGTGELKLKYDNWGNGAVVAADVISYFNTVTDAELAKILNGTYTPSFADDVDELFVLVKDTAVGVFGENDAVGVLQGAADVTTGTITSAETLANYWSSSAWDNSYLMGANANQYDGNANKIEDTNILDQAVANAAVVKARNTAMGVFLRDNGFPELYSVFADFNYENSIVPMDAAHVFLNQGTADPAAVSRLTSEIMAAVNNDQEKFALATTYAEAYFMEDPNNQNTSAAYRDGLAYYAMMGTVDNVNNSEGAGATYWEDMKDAVSLYGSIARGEATLGALTNVYDALNATDSNSVVITIMCKNGEAVINVSPAAVLQD